MKTPQPNPYSGSTFLETVTAYFTWGGAELFQAFLGCVWIGFLLAFMAFAMHYYKYYDMGVRQGDKSYYLSYLDLKKVSKRIVIAFLMFAVGTFFMSFAEGFNETILKGIVLSILVYPPLYYHYSDETQYQFHFGKGD